MHDRRQLGPDPVGLTCRHLNVSAFLFPTLVHIGSHGSSAQVAEKPHNPQRGK